MTEIEDSTMYTTQEAAAALGLTVRGVQWRIKHGFLRAQRVGARMWMIPADELEQARAVGRLPAGRKAYTD